MTERQQNVAPRERRATQRRPASPKPRAKAGARGASAGLWLRAAGAAVVLAAVAAGYVAVADSATFALSRVEVEGARRLSAERVEEIARKAAGPGVLGADLDAIRDAVAAESAVRSVSVVRVLPDAIRVRIEEREPAVVVHLKSGRFGWADPDGQLLEGYAPEPGTKMPPPLSGFDEGDRSERAAADNRDRVARYQEIRAALEAGGLWDRVDEVDLRYVKDPKVLLADPSVAVRLGDRNFSDRLARASRMLEAARLGDADVLTSLNIRGIPLGELIARAELINYVDAADDSGRLTVGYRPGAPAVKAEAPKPGAVVGADAAARGAAPAAAPQPAAKPPAAKQSAAKPPEAKPDERPRRAAEKPATGDAGRRN